MLKVLPGVKGLIFDCDGTLVDTMPIHWEAWAELLLEAGCNRPEDYKEFIDSLSGVPTSGIIEKLNEAFNLGFDVERASERKELAASAKLSRVRRIEPVVKLVQENLGKLPMAVASGGVRMNVERALDAVGLLPCFSAVVTASDAVKPKPSPEIFLEAARRLGIRPRLCQVFEDGDCGIQGARSAGMAATDVRPFV